MEENNIELIRVIIGLREEYRKNQRRLEELRKLVALDPEKYQDLCFYIEKVNEQIKINLLLLGDKKAPKGLRRLFTKKQEIIPSITMDENGEASITGTDGVEISNQRAFNNVVTSLLNDRYLNGNFNNIAIVGDGAKFIIRPTYVELHEFDNDPRLTRYNAKDDTVECVYYDRKYRLGRAFATEMLYTPIPRENISLNKQAVIANNPDSKKEILLDEDAYFHVTYPARLSVLELGIETDDKQVRLRMK